MSKVEPLQLHEKKYGAILFFSALLIAYVRFFYQASYFPAYFLGEEATVLINCENAWNSVQSGQPWLESFKFTAADYNKGYSWFFLPLYGVFGYDARMVTLILPLFASFFCALYFRLHQKLYPDRSSLIAFLLVVGIGLFALCVRRYKWHAVSYPAVLSLYFFFRSHFGAGPGQSGEGRRRTLSGALFLASCFLYFGNIIFAVPLLFFVLVFDLKKSWVFKLLVVVLGVAVIAALGYVTFKVNRVFADRITYTVQTTRELLTPAIRANRLGTIKMFFFDYLSPSFRLLFLFGISVSVWRAVRGDRFAIMNLGLFAWTLAVQFAMHGVSNPDTLNWSMLPFLGILFAGADEIYRFCRDRVRCGRVLFLATALLIVGNEYRIYAVMVRGAYYQQCVHPGDTATQAALILHLINEDNTGKRHYFLPEEHVPRDMGGFAYENNLKRVEYRRALSRLTFFSDQDDLREKIKLAESNSENIAFLSVFNEVQSDEANARSLLPTLQPEMIYPFEQIYRIKFPVRKYRLEQLSQIPHP